MKIGIIGAGHIAEKMAQTRLALQQVIDEGVISIPTFAHSSPPTFPHHQTPQEYVLER